MQSSISPEADYRLPAVGTMMDLFGISMGLQFQVLIVAVQAAAPLQAFISAHPNTIDGDLAVAEFAQWRGKYDDALAAATAALKLDPWNLEAHEFFVDLCPKIDKKDEPRK